MSLKNSKTTTSGLEWNTMLGLLVRLRKDNKLRDYLLIATGCYFGVRGKDLLNLKWFEVVGRNEITIVESKTGKKRKLTLNLNLKEVFNNVKEYLIREGRFDIEGYLFSNRKGGRLTLQFVNKQLHKIFDEYNVRAQNGSTHTLRKTFGKRVWEMDNKSERSLIYLSEIFSHSSIATTKRYIGITDKVIADVYLKL